MRRAAAGHCDGIAGGIGAAGTRYVYIVAYMIGAGLCIYVRIVKTGS